MYGVVCIQLSHSSLEDREDTFVTHLIVISKLEVSNFPIIFIFFSWLYVGGGCSIIFYQLLYIYIYIYIYWEILVLFPLLLYSYMMRANTRIHRSLKVVFVCLLIIHRRFYICIIIWMSGNKGAQEKLGLVVMEYMDKTIKGGLLYILFMQYDTYHWMWYRYRWTCSKDS